MCSGSGYDELFESPCLCTQKEVAPLKPAFRRGGDAVEATPVPMGARSFKVNKFPGSCDRCGGRVEAEAGILVKVEATGKWGARHHEGQCVTAQPATPAPSSVPAGLRDAERVIPNRFEKGCFRCGTMVLEGEGFAALQFGRWSTFCFDCAHIDREAEAAKAAALKAEAEAARAKLTGLVDHILATAYPADERKIPTIRVAVPATGENDLDFLIVQRAENDVRRVLRTLGGHGDITILLAEQVRQAERLAKLDRAELIEAAATYGRELGYCGRCGRELTDKDSRDAGLGPDCAKKG